MTKNNPNQLSIEKPPLLAEVGGPGYKRHGGYITEEYNPNLVGRKGARMYREISDNDPAVGGALAAMKFLMRQAEWGYKVDEDRTKVTPEHNRWADFGNECLDDMETGISLVIDDTLSLVEFGFSIMFDSYKIRRGDSKNPMFKSKHNDGLVGIKDIEIRKQDTIERWIYDEITEKPIGFLQNAPPFYKQVTIPLDRVMHFKVRSGSGSPEGRSMLRNVYRPYFRSSKIEDYQAVGIERDLAGLPVIFLPAEMMSPTASTEQKAIRAMAETLVQKIRRDQQEGVVFPSPDRADGGKTGYDFKLMSSGGSRQFNTVDIMRYYDGVKMIALLHQFMLLGQTMSGSRALSSDQTELSAVAMGAIMDSVVDVFIRTLTPRLFGANNVPREYWPKFFHGDIEKEDVSTWIASVKNANDGGLLLWTDNDEKKVRDTLDLDQRDEQDEILPKPSSAPTDIFNQQPQEPVVNVDPETEPETDEPEENEVAVGLDEIAEMLNVSRNSVKNAIKRGQLPGVKFGNKFRVMPSDVKALIRGGLL